MWWIDEEANHIAVCRTFLSTFETKDGSRKYTDQLQEIANFKSTVLTIHVNELLTFIEKDSALHPIYYSDVKKLLSFLYGAADELCPEPTDVAALEQSDRQQGKD